VPFAFAVAAMLQGDVSSYVARVRPWPLVTIAVLGAGICMGGLWAYETQGWGGFWAWDPVENASFVPWLFVATLLHGYIVQVTRNKWRFS
ncbi:cytochrome c biogenesis protein CcsA, partial [Enterococcus gallinarum]|uniref:cytochrome c biogenesis protein CcsA n=1 Tax=Enterococcus gallinarum TaxID=1353 RepID=UPI003D0C5F14